MKISYYKLNENLYKCECGREFNNSQSYNGHLSHCKVHHEHVGKEMKLRPHERDHKMAGWDKFSEDEVDELQKKSSEVLRQQYKNGELVPYWLNDTFDKTKARQKLSAAITKLRQEGKGYCRGTMGYYKGIHCDSSWELAFLLYCLDNNIKIERCKIHFEYEYNGTIHRYTPDFIVNDNELIEIKGFKDRRWSAKMECCKQNNIKVLDREEMKFYVDYAKEHYGRNFTDLYEK